MADFYHQKNRELQGHFGTRALADRINELVITDSISDEAREFIAAQNMLFISTVDEQGRPTVSYKGGARGFVKVLDGGHIAFPLYDGNGMFLSAGNINCNHHVGLLFIDFENPHRLRLHGTATVSTDDELMAEYHEAQMIVRIKVRNVFINCPRYIHPLEGHTESVYVPREGIETPDAEWKLWDILADVVPGKAVSVKADPGKK